MSADESKMQIILNNFKDTNPNRFEENINNPNLREEILQLIDRYYFDETINSSENELIKLNDHLLDKDEINNLNLKLQLQLQIVSRKMSDLILRNSDKCMQQLQNVTELKRLLEESNAYCSVARFSLKKSQAYISLNALNLLQNEIKKKHLLELLKSLFEIKKFHQQNNHLKNLIEQEKYSLAIELCLNLKTIAKKFDQFNSIRDTKFKLQERLEQIEESLDKKAYNLCFTFDPTIYSQLVNSHQLLDKLHLFIDNFNLHFLSAINDVSQSTVIEFLVHSYPLESLGNKSFKEICELVRESDYQKCLSRVCLQLWFVMRNYQRAHETHEKINTVVNESGEFDTVYIRQKYENGKLRLWQEVQQKISTCFRSMCLNYLKFDDFMVLIDVSNRLLQIGQEYCAHASCDSSILLDTVRDQTLAYFESFHAIRLDELKMFLENEHWEWCPIKSSFSIMNLHEFKFMCNQKRTKKISSSQSMNSLVSTASSCENPFEIRSSLASNQICDEEQEEIFDSAYDEEENEVDELRQEVISENGSVTFVHVKRSHSSPDSHTPIVTNTTLNLIRLFGKYLNIITKLKIISYDILTYMMQLFYYYLNYVIYNFAQREIDFNKGILSDSLMTLLKSTKVDHKIDQVQCELIKTRDDYLNALKQRVIIAESLIFVAEQVETLIKIFSAEDFSLSAKHTNVDRNRIYFEQFIQVLKEASQLRGPIFMHVVRHSCDYSRVYETISKINWDLDEIMSTHNKYVDVLIQQVKQLINDIDHLSTQIPISSHTKQSILTQCVRIIMRTLVDGYSQAKKCSIEGRALMQLDFQSFINKLEKVYELRPIPEKDYVENFIKAFYLPDNSIEKWLKDHQEYSNRQTQALIGVMTHLSRKTRFNLNTFFDSNT